MKKITTYFLCAMVALFVCACGKETEDTQTTPTDTVLTEAPESTEPSSTLSPEPTSSPEPTPIPKPTPTLAPTVPTSSPVGNLPGFGIDLDGIDTTKKLETQIEEYIEVRIESLQSRWESLSAEIDTYEKYSANRSKVFDFYETIVDETDQMCIMLYEYTAAYARMVLDSGMSADDMYDEIDGINDCIYDDACDEINDEIYEGIFEDINEFYYEGILEDAEYDDFGEWYDICSEEYSKWYEANSDVYSLYYDTASDIYSFYADMSGRIYSEDVDRAEKCYDRFLNKINRVKGLVGWNSEYANKEFDTTVRKALSIEELETTVEAHVDECIQILGGKWSVLSSEINTYDKYVDNAERVEAFHQQIEESATRILNMICKYGVSYAEMIMQSNLSNREKYKAFEDMRDCIYEDACALVKGDIYEELLEEIKDVYYDGIIYDAKEDEKYSEWSDVRGDAYDWWSDARSEVYDAWSDVRSDLYSFCSDIRSELYSDDVDGANKELQDFKDKVSKME